MAPRVAALGLVLLAACTEVDDAAVPDASHVERLEAALARHPCVGEIRHWQRNYRYSRRTGLFSPYSLNPDLDVIEFHLRRSGPATITPGLNLFPPAAGSNWPDSQAIKVVDGRYRLTDGSLQLAPCKPLPNG